MAGATNLPPKMIYPKQFNIQPEQSFCSCLAPATVAIPKKQKCPCSSANTPSDERLTFGTTEQLVDSKARVQKMAPKRRSPILANGRIRPSGCAVNFIGNEKATDELLQQASSGNHAQMQGLQAGQSIFQAGPFPMQYQQMGVLPNGGSYGPHAVAVPMPQVTNGHAAASPTGQFDMSFNGAYGAWNGVDNGLGNGLGGGMVSTGYDMRTNGLPTGHNSVPLAVPIVQPVPKKAPCCSSKKSPTTPPQPSVQAAPTMVPQNLALAPNMAPYDYNVAFYEYAAPAISEQYPYEYANNGTPLPAQHPSPTPCDDAWATGCQCGPSCNCPMCPQHPYNDASKAWVYQIQSIYDPVEEDRLAKLSEGFKNGEVKPENDVKQEGMNAVQDISPVLPVTVLDPQQFVFIDYSIACDCPDGCARADGECCQQRRSFEQLQRNADTNEVGGANGENGVQMRTPSGHCAGKMAQPMQLSFPQHDQPQFANAPPQQQQQMQQHQQQQQQQLQQQLQQQQQARQQHHQQQIQQEQVKRYQEHTLVELEKQQLPLQMPQVTQPPLQATV
ncbi:hypothetical protein BJ508DRAFT_303634 [Ascobolus immersus RN42]|uniref:Copper-fist domain-containing protein n=1 Tax=Ascobolus immersus RN42 TaxID=1160509 RepID=A0A3N4IEI5_ASCIM|nr:hypothetical protein BJ508DRAFT_303634 [Ascobolus immersus RN42]